MSRIDTYEQAKELFTNLGASLAYDTKMMICLEKPIIIQVGELFSSCHNDKYAYIKYRPCLVFAWDCHYGKFRGWSVDTEDKHKMAKIAITEPASAFNSADGWFGTSLIAPSLGCLGSYYSI